MVEKSNLTIADIARVTGIAESTLRFYRDKFGHYIPFVGEGRKRRYEPKALEIFNSIADLSNKGLSVTDIENQLSSNYAHNPIIVEDEKPQYHSSSAVTATTAVEPQCLENPVFSSVPPTAEPQYHSSSAVTAMEPQYVMLMEILAKMMPQKQSEKLYCTVKDAAVRTGFSQDFIRKSCRDYLQTKRGIPCARTGRGYVIHKGLLDDWFTEMLTRK